MYLYFFDLDDTICNTLDVITKIEQKHSINKDDFKDIEDYHILIEEKLTDHGFDKIEPLKNSTMLLLKELIRTSPEDVYYITAREGRVREESISWLKEHNLYLGEERLIMDTRGIKGKTINEILSNLNGKEFAFLFDDLMDNHKEASNYKNIIACLPI